MVERRNQVVETSRVGYGLAERSRRKREYQEQVRFLSLRMSLKSDLKKAQDAVDKLNAYTAGLKAAGSNEPTAMYRKLNRKANEALEQLPAIMRTRFVIDVIRFK